MSIDSALPLLLAADPPAGNPPSSFTFLWPLLAIGILFYFMLIRPEKRKQSEVQRMQLGLQKNDHVVTVGGILGVVVNAPPGAEEITIRVDESSNTRLRVLRSAISRVVSGEKAAEAPEAK